MSNGLIDPSHPPIRSALTPAEPPTFPWRWQYTRKGPSCLPPESDRRPFVLQLTDGAFVIGHRQTLRAVHRSTGPEFVHASAVPHVAARETHWVVGGQPVEVLAFAPLEPPP
jgi:hypothetical protein